MAFCDDQSTDITRYEHSSSIGRRRSASTATGDTTAFDSHRDSARSTRDVSIVLC